MTQHMTRTGPARPAHPGDEPRAGIGRVTAGVVAMAATLPYLTLKTLWLTGHLVGVTDEAFLNDPTMVGMNAMTFGMDAVALALALSFTTRWGMRLPGWLVLLPLWVASGLLGIIVATVPLAFVAQGPSLLDTGGPIRSWVYATVYGGFIVQGVCLLTAFALYTRDRWGHVLLAPVARAQAGPSAAFRRVVATGALGVSVLLGGTRLYWAAGGDAGLPPEMAAAPHSFNAVVQDGLKGLLTVGGAVALLAVVRARGRGPLWRPLTVAWLGSGTMFAWGLYAMVIVVTGAPLGGGPGGALGLVQLFETLTGLVMGMCGAFLLAERGSGVGHVQAAQHPLEREDREGDGRAADRRHG
ncbi:hypothetical protein [Nonomuraea roseoviolacea]|uniref:DUF998 domain-containing protein n=1 Tax=Nonomuraea roseoviolacea subsp. carminata TaxID=160689 RepID=A0ABT1JTV3_9ACTN|nr:hypothetical protein [Nonomuraea roseoviolacea]MCP2345176.1 hypothetical protein [Nonomuraea roseoviolacea subsp. carminata]